MIQTCIQLQRHQKLIQIISEEALKIETLEDSLYKQKKESIIDFLIELQCLTSKGLTHV